MNLSDVRTKTSAGLFRTITLMNGAEVTHKLGEEQATLYYKFESKVETSSVPLDEFNKFWQQDSRGTGMSASELRALQNASGRIVD